MAGIIAATASKPMVAGDTSASDVESGYVTGEQVALSTSPTGSAYQWNLSIPASSSAARSALSDDDVAAPVFTPDVAGEYVLTCIVDSATSYVLRMSVVALAATSPIGALRMLPMTNAQVPTPASGVTLFYSSTESALAIKDSAGAVSTVDVTAT